MPDVRPLLLALVLAIPVGGSSPEPAEAQTPGGRLQVGLGYLDLSAHHGPAAALEAEYRWDRDLVWRIRPQAGASVYSDASSYLHAGIHLPLGVGGRLMAAPAVSAGLYRQGADVLLGSALEFRSGLTLGLDLGEGRRLALFFYHLSNGGIGERNPGVEVGGLGYSIRH